MALITYEMAKAHLKLGGDEEMADVVSKSDLATAIVLKHLKLDPTDTDFPWTVESDPSTDVDFAIVQAAILKVLGNLRRFTGDDSDPRQGPLSPDVVLMLSSMRDPTLA